MRQYRNEKGSQHTINVEHIPVMGALEVLAVENEGTPGF